MLKFDFKLGELETHHIEFYFNQFWGNLYIKVDGRNIMKTIRVLSFSLTKSYEFDVGIEEIHQIKIENIRKLIFAGFREYVGKIYIDGNLKYEFKGKPKFEEVFKF